MKKTLVLMAGITGLFLAGCCTTQRPAHWEHTQVGSLKEANDLGAKGWEIVGFWYEAGQSIYVLKRPASK